MDRFDVEKSPRYRLAALARQWILSTEKIFEREVGLSLSEWRIVAIVRVEQPINAGAIVDRGLLEKSHISRLVARLVGRGLVISEIDAKDARKAWLSLTAEGERLYERAAVISQERDRLFLAPLSADERRDLEGLIDKLTQWTQHALVAG